MCLEFWWLFNAGGYILDIDLDYFHTQKSISPHNQFFFSKLVKESVAITIAKESRCVLDLRTDGEEITSKSLLKDLLDHIARILSN